MGQTGNTSPRPRSPALQNVRQQPRALSRAQHHTESVPWVSEGDRQWRWALLLHITCGHLPPFSSMSHSLSYKGMRGQPRRQAPQDPSLHRHRGEQAGSRLPTCCSVHSFHPASPSPFPSPSHWETPALSSLPRRSPSFTPSCQGNRIRCFPLCLRPRDGIHARHLRALTPGDPGMSAMLFGCPDSMGSAQHNPGSRLHFLTRRSIPG